MLDYSANICIIVCCKVATVEQKTVKSLNQSRMNTQEEIQKLNQRENHKHRTTWIEGTAIEMSYTLRSGKTVKGQFKFMSMTAKRRCRIQIIEESWLGVDASERIIFMKSKTVNFSTMLKMQYDFLNYCHESEVVMIDDLKPMDMTCRIIND